LLVAEAEATAVEVVAQEHFVLLLASLLLLARLIQLLLAQVEILALIRQEVQMVEIPYLMA
jgi:hypothetical protein